MCIYLNVMYYAGKTAICQKPKQRVIAWTYI